MQRSEESYKQYIREILHKIGVVPEHVEKLTRQDTFKIFVDAITHSTSVEEIFDEDYEVLEFQGDLVMDLALGMIMHEKFGSTVKDEDIYSKMKDFYASKPRLASMVRKSGLFEWMRHHEMYIPSEKAISDLFESLTGALFISANTHIAPTIGLLYAKNLVAFFIENFFDEVGEKFDWRNPNKYRNARDRLKIITDRVKLNISWGNETVVKVGEEYLWTITLYVAPKFSAARRVLAISNQTRGKDSAQDDAAEKGIIELNREYGGDSERHFNNKNIEQILGPDMSIFTELSERLFKERGYDILKPKFPQMKSSGGVETIYVAQLRGRVMDRWEVLAKAHGSSKKEALLFAIAKI